MMDTQTQSTGYEADKGMIDLAVQFNKNVRPLLDAVHKLQNLEMCSKEITLPTTIAVVGERCSGKTSLLESLIGISLPREEPGVDIRRPLVLHLQNCSAAETSTDISHEYTKAVRKAATAPFADKAISLHIRKQNAPDLTFIDLPGIAPLSFQIEERATMNLIAPDTVIILNVLAANVVFSPCKSTRLSQEVDKLGKRTVTVVTKVDQCPQEFYDTVIATGVHSGYIYVRNRTTDDGTQDEARNLENQLFETHPSLSQLDKRSVGISALAERITMIQAKMIRSHLTGLQKYVDRALTEKQKELDALRRDFLCSDGIPKDWVMQTMLDTTTTMQERMLNGNYADRLGPIFQSFSNQLDGNLRHFFSATKTQEISNRITGRSMFRSLEIVSTSLMKSLVNEEIDKVSDRCTAVVRDAHSEGKLFAIGNLNFVESMFPIFLQICHQVVEEVISASLVTCMDFVHRILAKEKSTVFTLNHVYNKNLESIQTFSRQDSSSSHNQQPLHLLGVTPNIAAPTIIQFGEATGKPIAYQSAIELKWDMVAYLSVVYGRMADGISLEVRYSLENALLKNLNKGLLKAARGEQMSQIMKEHDLNIQKRENLLKHLDVLKDCKDVLRKSL